MTKPDITINKVKKYTLIFLSFLFLHSCNGQNNNDINSEQNLTTNSNISIEDTDTILTLLTYGFPDFERQNSENVIAKKWGIRFYAVAGCVVTEELIDSVKTNNDKINSLIERKYGTGWREKFEKEVDEEFEKEKIITQVLNNIDLIKKKDQQMSLQGNGLLYYMTPIGDSGDYNISIEGWGTIDNKNVWVSYYRMTVNYKTKEYKLIDDKVEKIE